MQIPLLTNILIPNFSPSCLYTKVAWPSGLRRWFKAPVSSEAWVRIPPLPNNFSQKIERGHTDLNHGPIGLQPIALPLSYIPNVEFISLQ